MKPETSTPSESGVSFSNHFDDVLMKSSNLRNVGISAHIDSGKTTLSERMLFYTGRIHKMEEVHGDGAGATMDHMELEKERGITITSAATTVAWENHSINLIDTPGHVDFTVEVERSLRVLDGAVLVLCSVGGVQAQSITVDRQMKRYHIPRLALINKMDRIGADPVKVCSEVCEKLACDAFLAQLPIGKEDQFEGVIDLVAMRALYFDGDRGETVRSEPIPAAEVTRSELARQYMLEALSMYSDELMERLLSEEEVSEELVNRVMRDAVQTLSVTPVFVASALKNKGIQPVLDAIIRYLPSPEERMINASSCQDPETSVHLVCDAVKPFVGMAFKIVDDPYGQLTFMRIYQGTVHKGQTYVNQRTSRKERFSRILRIHADRREEVTEARAGDIVAVTGIDATSGDTFAEQAGYCTLESMFVPEPVIKIAVRPLKRVDGDRLAKALARFRKEDPTFRVTTDPETGETLMAGMGELHLEVYVERIRREYKVEVEVGAPSVSYREAPVRSATFNYKYKKQTGGAGQYAHLVGKLEPLAADVEEDFVFQEKLVGGRIPKEYIPSIEKGFRASLLKGPIAGFPIVGVGALVEDGSHHEVDSSDMAFQAAARLCFRDTFSKMKPVLLEPIMKVEIESPANFQGSIAGDLTGRRGIILSTEFDGNATVILAELPLAETFGYSTDLRSMTQGQGTFSMEFHRYRRVPVSIQEDVVSRKKKAEAVTSG